MDFKSVSARVLGVLFLGSTSALAADLLPQLVSKVSPSVVNIQASQAVKNSSLGGFYGLGNSKVGATALGTGFVVASTSVATGTTRESALREVLVLTNNHVIANADEIQIMTRTHSERFLAKVVARDQVTDIAVLKVSLPVVIQPLFVGDSEKLEVGESVFAIGNPFGLGHTVTRGIVSAKDRSLGVGRIDRYLQTDASINPGNSGGPLFNFKGEVVGINTLSRVGAQGIGFAIPSNTIKKILPILERSGRLDRCWIGVAGVADSKGVLVTSLVKSSPAYELGLKEGDLLLSINVDGTPTEISSLWVLRDVLETSTPGQKIEFQVKRGEKLFLGKLELKTRPSDDRLPEGYDFF